MFVISVRAGSFEGFGVDLCSCFTRCDSDGLLACLERIVGTVRPVSCCLSGTASDAQRK